MLPLLGWPSVSGPLSVATWPGRLPRFSGTQEFMQICVEGVFSNAR